jgi:drug/metabolite transporter (DMT)-like permease
MTVAVLVAAFTHALWHAMLKSGGDQLQTIAAVYVATALVCAAAAPLVALPTPAAFGLIGLSVALHCGSYLYIARAYTSGDLAHAFPLYRGLAPLLVALGAWGVTGERLAPPALLGLALAATGVACLAFERGLPWRGHAPVGALMISALFVAVYTVVDGIGVRLSPSAVGYVVWLFLLNGPAIGLIAWVARRRGARASRLGRRRVAVASVLALFSHGIVIWAMSVGALATVAALRETSVVFAALIGTLVLRERFGRTRVLAAVLVATGVALLHDGG